MGSETAPTVAVVGGGLSGALVAERLLRSSDTPLRVIVIESREAIGAGFAYSTDHPEHVLNVPSKSMSAVDGEPDHFVAWLRGEGLVETDDWGASSDPDGFVPRGLYGSYVGRLVAEAARNAAPPRALIHERGVATSLTVEAGRIRVSVGGNRTIEADRAVLALGNPPPANPTPGDLPFYSSPRYLRDAWDPEVGRGLSPAAPVLVLGTGLTMLDVALTLDKEGHRGTITALSTHGLVPPPHRLPLEAIPPFLVVRPSGARIAALFRDIRDRAGDATSQGHDWRAVMDSIRPLGQEIWRSLGEIERRRFLRHVRCHWEVHRHRAAPVAAEQVARLRRMGRLVIRAGRIVGFVERGRRVDVTFQERGPRGQKQMTQVERVINATGPEMNFRRVRDPLIRQLLHDGLCRPGPLDLGFDATAEGAIIGADGRPSAILSTVGPPLRGVLWETTAVPEIRAQAAALARRIVGGFD
jgi:uncharacterized NAD(P)/FAD-binding protein YdhS